MDLTKTDFAQYVKINRPLNGGHQLAMRFPNNYGVSLIKGPYSYGGDSGKYEIAIILFDGENEDFSICYDTPITDDVLGHLSKEECIDIFNKTLLLDKKEAECKQISHQKCKPS